MEPKRTYDEATLREVYRFRVLTYKADGVLPPSLAPDADIWHDEHDDHGIHWVIEKEGEIIAAARLCIHQAFDGIPDMKLFRAAGVTAVPPIACFNRLVVTPSERGNGLSLKLDKVRIHEAIRLGCKSAIVWTHNPKRVRPLENLGFKMIRETAHPTALHLPPVAVFMRHI